ncbi:MAG: transposase [Kiritimatiellae bacterium]|nr:transposase [Kiritimatiellia bacterium]MDD5521996.1 transposase [Kiritimatiellia bacterium]
MSRPLRVDVEGGWYHVSARGIERRRIFHEQKYYAHFLELMGLMSERYGVEVHAYCLMSNHYHLIIRTPHANASRSIQWLNVSYSAWYNAKRQRVGHVFQGRFNSVLIDCEGAWLLTASEYLHLNPVRTAGMGLVKKETLAESRGFREPTDEEVRKRLEKLRQYRWSSYGAYTGYTSKPGWLHTEVILGRCGGKNRYRKYVQEHITRGADPEVFECLKGRLAIGSRGFVEGAKKLVKKVTKEQPDRKAMRDLVEFGMIMEIVEKEKNEKWEEFRDRHADCGRDLVLYLARQRSGLTMPEIGEKAGGLHYKVVEKAVGRFAEKIKGDRRLRLLAQRCLDHLSYVGT